jgi:capsular polysaccharide biosynthesis protein
MTEAIPRLIAANRKTEGRILILPDSFRNLVDTITPFYTGEIFWIPAGHNVAVEDLLVPENPPVSGEYDPAVLAHMRRRYLSDFSLDLNTANNRTYISRDKAKRRKVANEKEVLGLLRPFGFVAVDFAQESFKRQVAISACSEIFVGVHGAGLVNMIFMRPGATVIELQKEPYDNEEISILYMNLAHAIGLKYTRINCHAQSRTQSIYDADIVVNLDSLKSVLPFIPPAG